MLITLNLTADNIGEEHFHQIVKEFGKVIVASLRRSDVVFQSRSNQFFLLFPKMTEEYIDMMTTRIKKKFREAGLDDVMTMDINYELIVSKREDELQ
jgi:GGDEF domain-containing protein